MEKTVKGLPTGSVSNVIHLATRQPVKQGLRKALRIESLSPNPDNPRAEPVGGWVGGIADGGKVHITLEVSTLTPDAARSFAKNLLTLADVAQAQAGEPSDD